MITVRKETHYCKDCPRFRAFLLPDGHTARYCKRTSREVFSQQIVCDELAKGPRASGKGPGIAPRWWHSYRSYLREQDGQMQRRHFDDRNTLA